MQSGSELDVVNEEMNGWFLLCTLHNVEWRKGQVGLALGGFGWSVLVVSG